MLQIFLLALFAMLRRGRTYLSKLTAIAAIFVWVGRIRFALL